MHSFLTHWKLCSKEKDNEEIFLNKVTEVTVSYAWKQ